MIDVRRAPMWSRLFFFFFFRFSFDRFLAAPCAVPFHCRECGKGYETKADLDFHVGKRHNFGNQGAFACAQCEKRYVCVEDLDFHVARRHALDNAAPSPPVSSVSPGATNATKMRSATSVGTASPLFARRQTSPAMPLRSVSEGLHVAVRARNAPEANELSFGVGDKLLVLKVDAAHQRVFASNESRGSVSGWAPFAAIRPATDAEIASRVSGVATAYVASVNTPLAAASALPDVPGGSGPTSYSSGVSKMKFPSADSLPSDFGSSSAAAVVPATVVRNTPSNRVGRIVEASAEQQYGFRPRGPVSDPYAAVTPEIAASMDQMAAVFAAPVPVQREGIAAGYAAARPAAPLPQMQPPQRQGIARGYSSGPAPAAGPTTYTRPGARPQPQPVGEQYGNLQLMPPDPADEAASFF